MRTRTTKRLPTDVTPLQFEEAMARYAEAEQREQEICAGIEAEVSLLQQQHQEELSLLARAKHEAFDLAQSFCSQNKDTLFRSRRSIGTLHGIAGFRLGTPRLKTIDGNDWKAVLAQLKEKLPDYVRTTEEPARDLLLAHRHKTDVAPLLMEVGVHVVQDELFYIDTGKTLTEKAPAAETNILPPAPRQNITTTTIPITKKAA
jgi:hypothetical protein